MYQGDIGGDRTVAKVMLSPGPMYLRSILDPDSRSRSCGSVPANVNTAQNYMVKMAELVDSGVRAWLSGVCGGTVTIHDLGRIYWFVNL